MGKFLTSSEGLGECLCTKSLFEIYYCTNSIRGLDKQNFSA